MAWKDIMTINEGSAKMDAVNLDFRVGVGGENRSPDVMVVQSLIQYIGLDQDISRHRLGNMIIPKIDGICGGITLRAIRTFQHMHTHRLLRVDGVIHPAKYGKRNIDWGRQPPR